MTWVGLAVVVFLATVLQVGAGVGFGSIAGPGTMLLAPPLMPGAILCLSFVSAGLAMRQIVGKVAKGQVVLALIGRSLGAAVSGWLIARAGSKEHFALLFAGLTLLGVVLSVAGPKLAPTPPVLLGAGFLSGLMATVTTIGGPPMALVYQHQPAAEARATLNAFFAFGVIPPVVALWLAGSMDWLALGRAALLLPAVALGLALAHLASAFIGRRYRLILLVFCVAAAAIIGGRALLRLAF